MSDVDDGTLLARARRGDEEAFSLLFAWHQRAVYRYAAYTCGQDGAADVVQDTFLAILRQLLAKVSDRRVCASGLLQHTASSGVRERGERGVETGRRREAVR